MPGMESASGSPPSADIVPRMDENGDQCVPENDAAADETAESVSLPLEEEEKKDEDEPSCEKMDIVVAEEEQSESLLSAASGNELQCNDEDKSTNGEFIESSMNNEIPKPNLSEEKHKEVSDISEVERYNSSEATQSIEPVNNCYCGKERNLNAVELQCAGCLKWFHEECITISLGKCLPFMTYYTFLCKSCNQSGSETFSKKQPNFSQICATALANLTQQSNSKGAQSRSMFSKDKEVIPYIETNWEYLTSMPRRVKLTWHLTVYRAMMKDSDMFVSDESKTDESSNSDLSFGLANQDLSKIGPSYDSSTRSTAQKQAQETSQNVTVFSSGKGRSAKRRFFGDGQIVAGGKKIKSDLVMPKLPPNGYPLEHPFNKDGYRYILAEPDPHAPFRQEFDDSQDWAGKPIPGWLYRKFTPNSVLLALHDRAPQLKISEDRLSVTGEKGYCMVRATHGITRGTWYFEITIDDMSDGAGTRLGWSRPLGNLQAPLGYDKFSYSWRSRKGTKFHESKGYHYTDEGYGQGDTLGFLIHLPPKSEVIPLPPIFKDKPLVRFKSFLYYEEKDEPQMELKNLKPSLGSMIEFYKNGKSCGVAFENINEGIYFPAASLYKNCTVSFNFGPSFKFPPAKPFKAMHNAALEAIIEQSMTDLLFFTENKGKLRLDNI